MVVDDNRAADGEREGDAGGEVDECVSRSPGEGGRANHQIGS